MDGPVCEELAGAVQRKCFISVFDRDSREIPLPPPPRPSWNGARGRGWKNLITPGEGAAVAALTNTVDHGKQSSVFPIRVVPRSLETPVSATTTPCITRFIPFYSLTPGINNDLSRSIDVDVYRERY